MKEQLTSLLENSKQNTLNEANAMPEKDYVFRPVKEVWSFGELLHHIAYGIEWWEANFVKGTKTEWAPPASVTGKKEVIAYLNNAYGALATTISQPGLSAEAVAGFHATLDHITHHRGQATTYLRCNGIAAPDYMY